MRATYFQVMKLYPQICLHITPKYTDIPLGELNIIITFRKFNTDTLLFSNIYYILKILQLFSWCLSQLVFQKSGSDQRFHVVFRCLALSSFKVKEFPVCHWPMWILSFMIFLKAQACCFAKCPSVQIQNANIHSLQQLLWLFLHG